MKTGTASDSQKKKSQKTALVLAADVKNTMCNMFLTVTNIQRVLILWLNPVKTEFPEYAIFFDLPEEQQTQSTTNIN